VYILPLPNLKVKPFLPEGVSSYLRSPIGILNFSSEKLISNPLYKPSSVVYKSTAPLLISTAPMFLPSSFFKGTIESSFFIDSVFDSPLSSS